MFSNSESDNHWKWYSTNSIDSIEFNSKNHNSIISQIPNKNYNVFNGSNVGTFIDYRMLACKLPKFNLNKNKVPFFLQMIMKSTIDFFLFWISNLSNSSN